MLVSKPMVQVTPPLHHRLGIYLNPLLYIVCQSKWILHIVWDLALHRKWTSPYRVSLLALGLLLSSPCGPAHFLKKLSQKNLMEPAWNRTRCHRWTCVTVVSHYCREHSKLYHWATGSKKFYDICFHSFSNFLAIRKNTSDITKKTNESPGWFPTKHPKEPTKAPNACNNTTIKIMYIKCFILIPLLYFTYFYIPFLSF